MRLTLLVPDLLLPSGPDNPSFAVAHLPGLKQLLARSRRTVLEISGMEAWLCTDYAVPRAGDWPVAPFSYLADGGDPRDYYWLRCDPAHLIPRRSELILYSGAALVPTQDEASALISVLNAHFSQDGMVFHAPHPDRWYLRLASPPALTTHTPAEAANNDVGRCLPGGSDSLLWHQRLNEIQMLLHTHPVNETRESRGMPMINSVWLWGGGTCSVPPNRPYTQVWSNDALARGLAMAGGVATHAVPASAAPILSASSTAEERQLVVLPVPDTTARDGESTPWDSRIAALEKDWFVPLRAALRQRRISELSLIAPGADRVSRFDLARSDLWKIWRRFSPSLIQRTAD